MTKEAQTQHDMNIIAFARELWTAKAFLLYGLLGGLLLAYGVIVSSVPHFEARMMIGPAQGLQLHLPGSEELAPRGSAPEPHGFTRFEAIYTGPSVAGLLLRDQKLLEGLKADHAFILSGTQDEWSRETFSQYLGQRIWLDPFGETELRALHYRHPDPEFAAYLLQQVHRTADQLIRADIRGSVDERIAYLERLSAKTLNPEHRRAITGLLLEQERTRMMVSMDEPVAAKIIERASSLPKAVWPDRALLLCGFGLVGMFLGYVVFGLFRAETVEPVAIQQELALEEPPQPRKKAPSYNSWFKRTDSNQNTPPPKPFRPPPIDEMPRPSNTPYRHGDAAE